MVTNRCIGNWREAGIDRDWCPLKAVHDGKPQQLLMVDVKADWLALGVDLELGTSARRRLRDITDLRDCDRVSCVTLLGLIERLGPVR